MVIKKTSAKPTSNLYTATDSQKVKLNRIGVIIPAFQAQDTIGSIIIALKRLGFAQSNIIVVDDGSTDRTFDIAENHGVVVLQHKGNYGKGAALKTGFKSSLAAGLEAVITLDADNQHLPHEIYNFINGYLKGKSDLLLGFRKITTTVMPLIRVLVNRTTSLVVSLLIKKKIPDSQCGFRLITTDLLKKIKLKTSHFETESELIIQSSLRKFTIGSIPVTTVYANGQSHIHPLIDTLRFIAMAVKCLWR